MVRSETLAVVAIVVATCVAGATAVGPLPRAFQYPRVVRARNAYTPSLRRASAPAAGVGGDGGAACPLPPPLGPLPSPLSPNTTQRLADLESRLEDLFTAMGATGGTATLVYDQDVLLQYNFGATRVNGTTAVTGDTGFRLASNTKVFTSLMMFKLRDAGKLALEDEVSERRLVDCPSVAHSRPDGLSRDVAGARGCRICVASCVGVWLDRIGGELI